MNAIAHYGKRMLRLLRDFAEFVAASVIGIGGIVAMCAAIAAFFALPFIVATTAVVWTMRAIGACP